MSNFIKEYKGYKIWRDTRSIDQHNPRSGHSWIADIPLQQFYIVGKFARIMDTYKTIVLAEEHIDFLLTTY